MTDDGVNDVKVVGDCGRIHLLFFADAFNSVVKGSKEKIIKATILFLKYID